MGGMGQRKKLRGVLGSIWERSGGRSGVDAGEDKEGLTPLHLAMPSGSLTMTDVLVRFAADLNARCCRGQTVLHLAAKAGRDVVCQLLLAQGSEPNAVDAKARQGVEAARHMAASSRETPVGRAGCEHPLRQSTHLVAELPVGVIVDISVHVQTEGGGQA